MLLTISGPSGSGKTTVANSLSQRLGFAHISAGEVFRELARERALSLEQLSKLAEKDPEIDQMVDTRQAELAQSHETVIVDGRLSGWVLKGDIAVWLKAPLEVRAERIARREDKDRAIALRETRTRDSSEAARYLAFYNIDTVNLDIYDLIIDTRHWDQFAVIDIITQAVRSRREVG
ncbi:MAG: AAA family ATPase [Euryarchaeota archaeon]|nr:AAA family ATPase [Euryarchaeota archaeon]